MSKAVLNAVRIHSSPGATLPTNACVSCGIESGVMPTRIPRTFPVGALCGIAFALPLLLGLAIGATWGPHDLFDIMMGTGDPTPNKLHFLRGLPILVAALWSVAAVIVLEIFCWHAGLRLSLCRSCAALQRWRRAKLATVLVLAFVALAALMYLIPGLTLDDRKWGIYFALWIVLAALVANWTPLAGVRCRPLSSDVQQIVGASLAGSVVEKEQPDALAAQTKSSIWPPRIEFIAWTVPAVLLGISILGPRLESYPLGCSYGTYPMSHRWNETRRTGCWAPDGSAHGRLNGGFGAWSSDPQSPGYSGDWWFGQPHGEFAFSDRTGRVRARGHFVLGQARGRWEIFDKSGAILEELEVLTDPLRIVVLRQHPHLTCARSEIESTGMPAWGMRACPRYDQPAPFVRVHNAHIIETGMR
jgi:hypothetical protein